MFKGKLDLDRIGASGMSVGGHFLLGTIDVKLTIEMMNVIVPASFDKYLDSIKGIDLADRILILWMVLPMLLLVSGGSFPWWQAWACRALFPVPMTFYFAWKVRYDPSFIERRFKLRRRNVAAPSSGFGDTTVSRRVHRLRAVDHRFGWSYQPLSVVIADLILTLHGYLMILHVFMENRRAGRSERESLSAKEE